MNRQYLSTIFYHSDEQKRTAEESRDSRQAVLGKNIVTRIKPLVTFYDAEDYHQKYQLRQMAPEALALLGLWTGDEVKGSLTAARLNGYISGYGSEEDFDRDWPRFGIHDDNVMGIIRMRCAPASQL
ncbi:uncharacterized protein LOC135825825 [Sycon ciliatum]|uniref:uncharacterized protein LOC135825825 n=1 Tax=Sycon ciliatum TaxID=27933 RepID=UPI0020ADE614|eukprot:scpid84213/ scgid25886/ Peptide methionine sulfoxide reductase; Ecdysone-induced protein 28/29 kDa; Methionine-S-sulfoxide reductase; Peptide-methionine (S)-S-oxide reductase